MRVPAAVPVLLSAVVLSSCIERPEQPRAKAVPAGERVRLTDVLLTSPPHPQHLVNASFDNMIELVGYDVNPEPAPRGERVVVDVYYRALEDVTDDWQIFVHVEDAAHVLPRFNLDHWPAGDRLRTTAWHKGDFIRDQFAFGYPASVSSLELWTGFYQGDNRLPLASPGLGRSDGVNRLRIGAIPAR